MGVPDEPILKLSSLPVSLSESEDNDMFGLGDRAGPVAPRRSCVVGLITLLEPAHERTHKQLVGVKVNVGLTAKLSSPCRSSTTPGRSILSLHSFCAPCLKSSFKICALSRCPPSPLTMLQLDLALHLVARHHRVELFFTFG